MAQRVQYQSERRLCGLGNLQTYVEQKVAIESNENQSYFGKRYIETKKRTRKEKKV